MGAMLCIFDWDGTLSDSMAAIGCALHNAADALGLPRQTASMVRRAAGRMPEQAAQMLYPQDGALHHRLTTLYRQHLDRIDRRQPPPLYNGARQTLERLRASGHRLALATAMNRAAIDRAFAHHHLAPLFAATRTAAETSPKPDPQMLQEILRECGTSPDQAIMVGDGEQDMEMAHRAGMRAVAVAWGSTSKHRLAAHKPLAILDDIAELPALLPP